MWSFIINIKSVLFAKWKEKKDPMKTINSLSLSHNLPILPFINSLPNLHASNPPGWTWHSCSVTFFGLIWHTLGLIGLLSQPTKGVCCVCWDQMGPTGVYWLGHVPMEYVEQNLTDSNDTWIHDLKVQNTSIFNFLFPLSQRFKD